MAEYCYGIHTVMQLLESNPDTVLELFASKRQDKKIQTLLSLAMQCGISVQLSENQTLDKFSRGGNHQGIVARIKSFVYKDESQLISFVQNLPDDAFILALDGIQDPHNLGACLRTADAAGVHAVLLPKNRSVGVTAAVQKVSTGAVNHLPVYQVTNLVRSLEKLKQIGLWVIGADGEAEKSLYQANLRGPTVLVMGAEGTGMRRLSRDTCDHLLSIPMFGKVSSLNVSVATGICLYEIRRQRGIRE